MASLIERIERHSMPEPNTGCWLWFGSTNRLGYGRIGFKGQVEGAHRVSYRAFRGEIPEGLQVLHSCDVRCCVNPDHLFVGTASDNMLDMHAKGRHPKVKMTGVDHPMNKITETDAICILSAPKYTRGLSEKFGVGKSCIHKIRNGLTWKYLQPKGE